MEYGVIWSALTASTWRVGVVGEDDLRGGSEIGSAVADIGVVGAEL